MYESPVWELSALSTVIDCFNFPLLVLLLVPFILWIIGESLYPLSAQHTQSAKENEKENGKEGWWEGEKERKRRQFWLSLPQAETQV